MKSSHMCTGQQVIPSNSSQPINNLPTMSITTPGSSLKRTDLNRSISR
uniref:Uncharacterized protein n=1 Tax=Anguilla anguilla TaxID=7936 RepID=A0A0E9PB14_ANGAN